LRKKQNINLLNLSLGFIKGGSRGTSNNCVEEQKSNYLLRKTELKAVFPSPTQVFDVRTYLKSASYSVFSVKK